MNCTTKELYNAKKELVLDKLDLIYSMVKYHNAEDPDWNHIGDMSRILSDLNEVEAYLDCCNYFE